MQNTAPATDQTNQTIVEETPKISTVTALSSVKLKTQDLLKHDGPFLSVYFDLLGGGDSYDESDALIRWKPLHDRLQAEAISSIALDAATAAIAADPPDDVAGLGVIVAADGSSVIEYAHEPPAIDTAEYAPLPYVAPMLEWAQRRVPHIVATVDDEGCDLAAFGKKRFSEVFSYDGNAAELADHIANSARLISAELLLLCGPDFLARRLAETLAPLLPANCKVVVEEPAQDVDELVDTAVRHVSDTTARKIVSYLREFRFEAAHDNAVDGIDDTIEAIRGESAALYLVHDDPNDKRSLWFGREFSQVSATETPECHTEARLVDVVIRAALGTDSDVHIIPSTGHRGPDDDLAALRIVDGAPEIIGLT